MSIFKFTPGEVMEKERRERIVLPRDNYDLEIIEATNEISKSSGNPMLKLVIEAGDEPNRKSIIHEYIVDHPKLLWKIKNVCYCFGLKEAFDLGEIDTEHLKGRRGSGEVGIREDNRGQEQNFIINYHEGANQQHAPKITPKAVEIEDFDDEIPF